MDGGKQAHEAFRVGKFAHTIPYSSHHDFERGGADEGSASSQQADELDEDDAEVGSPDAARVILHFDAGIPMPEPKANFACSQRVPASMPSACVARRRCSRRPSTHYSHSAADCFYAQVEELRDPSLREKPLGISQKYLVVTCNYVARKAGVTKLMNIVEAKKKCVSASSAACLQIMPVHGLLSVPRCVTSRAVCPQPELVLVPGEDLTPYRKTSAAVFAVLSEFGAAAQKLGMDEVRRVCLGRVQMHGFDSPGALPCAQVFIDATAKCNEMVRSGCELKWCAHVHRSRHAVHSTSRYRPMDLRCDLEQPAAGDGEAQGVVGAPAGVGSEPTRADQLLMAGTVVAAQARAAVRERTGVRTSAGIAHNKLLAKLASGLHKPDDQTVLPATEALDFIRPLPVCVLRGAGFKTARDLERIGIQTVGQLRVSLGGGRAAASSLPPPPASSLPCPPASSLPPPPAHLRSPSWCCPPLIHHLVTPLALRPRCPWPSFPGRPHRSSASWRSWVTALEATCTRRHALATAALLRPPRPPRVLRCVSVVSRGSRCVCGDNAGCGGGCEPALGFRVWGLGFRV